MKREGRERRESEGDGRGMRGEIERESVGGRRGENMCRERGGESERKNKGCVSWD